MKLEKLKLSKKKILILIIILGSAFIAFDVFSKKEEKFVFLTEAVKKGSINQTVIATGTIRSNNRVDVGAQVSGEITKLNVTLGQRVKKGDLIATIDSTTKENELEMAKSTLISYEAQLESKKIDLEVATSKHTRSKKLYKLKAISQDDYEDAKQAYYDAKGELKEIEELIKQSEMEVKTAETNLSYTTILSPMDGVVISIPVSEGQTVNSNQTTPTIVQIADLDKMLIKPEISEGDITKLKVGQEVQFTILSAPEKVYNGKINSIDPATTTLTDDEYEESVSDTDAIYYYANVIVDNRDNVLRIGMTTTNVIKVAQAKDVLLVPSIALHKEQGKYFVEVLNSEEKTTKKSVEIGIKDDLNTEIVSGLQEGEKVVIAETKAGEVNSSLNHPPRF
ncbi:efflux RND transporter periplasmic adaptor subunit [Fusobacterium sp. MFO224]|uniref:efflux RND transporter periplasmic adaptor subunit n=1 Tax=Fusobacterium sp. MFO224 TaxID=3378070 RepID=UPI00385347AD